MSELEVLEDFKQYLPKYLSSKGTENLFAELKQFPNNIDGRLYTSFLEAEQTYFQGDGIIDLPIVNLPDNGVRNAKVMILSNTCDVDPENKRYLPTRMVYCPIMSFAKYQSIIEKAAPDISSNHFNEIRAQRVSSMFFLPRNESLGEEAVVLLDHANSCNISRMKHEEIPSRRLFTLSDYGFYLFIFKLSIHFTRIRESVRRTQE